MSVSLRSVRGPASTYVHYLGSAGFLDRTLLILFTTTLSRFWLPWGLLSQGSTLVRSVMSMVRSDNITEARNVWCSTECAVVHIIGLSRFRRPPPRIWPGRASPLVALSS